MNPLIALVQNLAESAPIVSKQQDKITLAGAPFSAEHIRSELEQKIQHQQLQIMLYGAYNAGKSTLINTLLGQPAAVVNDIPTTDKVDAYDWEDFCVLDTPGVNAPIAHENVTDAQVMRSGAMLFVIREGDQDAKNVYERLFDMLKGNKKVFIVLNHQLTNPEDKLTAVLRINEILAKLAPSYDVSLSEIGKIGIYPVNLSTAYKARVEQHEKLLAHSGYNAFVWAFKQWVQQQDNEQRHLETLKTQISELWYQPVISYLESQIQSQDDVKLKLLRDDRLMLESEQRALKVSVTNFITQQVNLLKSDVSNALQHSNSAAEVDSRLQSVFVNLPNTIEDWLGDEFAKVGKKLAVVVDYEHHQTGNTASGLDFDDIVTSAKGILTDKNLIKQGLLYLKRFKPGFLKGKGKVRLEGTAGKIAVGVQVFMTFYDIYKANADQNKENEQRRQHSVELYQAVDQICSSVISDTTTAVHEVINTVFRAQMTETQQQIDTLLNAEGELKADLEQLVLFKNNMLAVEWQ